MHPTHLQGTALQGLTDDEIDELLSQLASELGTQEPKGPMMSTDVPHIDVIKWTAVQRLILFGCLVHTCERPCDDGGLCSRHYEYFWAAAIAKDHSWPLPFAPRGPWTIIWAK